MKKLVALTICSSVVALLISSPTRAKDVTVCWKPPTTYLDGSTLTDLKGFRIEYGIGKFDKAVAVDKASTTCATITKLAPGTWLFRVVALTTGHGESDPSTSASQIIVPPATDGKIEDSGTRRTIPPKK